MKAQVVKVTPKVAQNYLDFNVKNRNIDESKVDFYSQQMINGEWKENGESIIFDLKGNLKDGQHRLRAIIKSNKSYSIPIVTGVTSDVMATIDTGKNRTLSDVLKLNGFKNPTLLAAISVKIIKDIKGEHRTLGSSSSKRRKGGVSNSYALDFCSENNDDLQKLLNEGKSLIKKSPYKILSASEVCFMLYIIGGFDYQDVHVSFLKRILGISMKEGTGSQYLHRKLFNAKINKDPLNRVWVLAIFIKAFNLFLDGDAPVKYLQYDLKTPFPKVSKI